MRLVIATEDLVNCLIHKTYAVEIENASVEAKVPVTKDTDDRLIKADE